LSPNRKLYISKQISRFYDRVSTSESGPRPITKGKVIPIERTLGGEGWLPNKVGTYNVVITWAPCASAKNPPSEARNQSADLKTYAVVHSSATIHIVDGEGSH
jgi:hypothetical protein